MTFSLRLTVDLTLALAAGSIGGKHSSPPVLYLCSESQFDAAPASYALSGPPSGEDWFPSVARVSLFCSPVVWIGGHDPLDHSQAARFANAVATSGRHVFLETSGALLKRRLHELQPSSRFYFAVRFDSRPSSEGRDRAGYGAARVGLEAIRMARLAGFFTCAHLVLEPDTPVGYVEQLHGEIASLGVDGFLITCAALAPELEKQAALLRRRLLSRRWALLARLLEAGASHAKVRTSAEIGQPPLPESQPDSFGEGAEAG